MGVVHLVRHGQASFGSDDYDVLSTLGQRQASLLGRMWTMAGPHEATHVSGALHRQVDTSTHTIAELTHVTHNQVDARWNEFNLLATMPVWTRNIADPREFQARFNDVLRSWMAGEHDAPETYRDFSDRVSSALDSVVASTGPGEVARVFTSAGPISWVASRLLVGDDSLFPRLNDVLFNTSVTTIAIGAVGPRLLTFNERLHLSPDMQTFR